MVVTKKRISGWVKFFYIRILFLILKPLKIDKNKVFIFSYDGKGFGDNGKAISLQLHEMCPEANIHWLVNKHDPCMPNWITQVDKSKCSLFAIIKDMTTSKVWLNNKRLLLEYRIKRNQFYINIWHGGTPLKLIEKDAGVKTGASYIRRAMYDSKKADLMISGNGFMTNLMKNSFWYGGPILEAGTPRLDPLFDKKNDNNRIFSYFSIDKSSHLILYAPTFRNNGSDAYKMDYELFAKAISERFRQNYKIIVRFHPNTDKNSIDIHFNNTILDGSDYPDMYELLPSCDMLITDYSSTMFEMAMIHKPVWLYTPDIESYIDERGFYFDLKELPFPLFTNNEEMINLIQTFDNNVYNEAVARFLRRIGIKEDGKASERVAKAVSNVLSGIAWHDGIENNRLVRL